MSLDAMSVMREVHRRGCYLLLVPEAAGSNGIAVCTLHVRSIAFNAPPIPESLLAKVREHMSELCSILAKMA